MRLCYLLLAMPYMFMSFTALANGADKQNDFVVAFPDAILKQCDEKLVVCNGKKLKVLRYIEDMSTNIPDDPSAVMQIHKSLSDNGLLIEAVFNYKTKLPEVIGRMVVESDAYEAPYGVRVGMKESRVIYILGESRVESGIMSGQLLYRSADGMTGIVLVVRHGVVTQIIYETYID